MPVYRQREGSIQDQFQRSRAKLQVFGGGFANGKTTTLVVKCLKLARDYPGSNGLIARSTYPKLNDTIRREFLKWIPASWVRRKPTQDDNTLIMVNGTTVNFRYIAQRGKNTEGGETTSNLLSATYDWIAVDQVEDPEITYKDLMDLLGRLRGQTAYHPEQGQDDKTMPSTGPRWAMLALNPTRGWFFKKIIQPYQIWKTRGIYTDDLMIDTDTNMPIMELYEGSTYTNKENLPADYIKTLEASYKGQQKKRFLLGEWGAFEGLVHPSFDNVIHMASEEEIRDYLIDCKLRHVRLRPWEMYDFGLTAPSCYMLGSIDEWGRCVILDGYYVPNFDYEDQIVEIKKIRARYVEYFKYDDAEIISDPAIFKRVVVGKRDTGDTVAQLLSAKRTNGLVFKPGNNSVAPGIAKINAYLHAYPHIPHAFTGKTPGPLLYICDKLTWFETEIADYRWRKNPQGNLVDEPIDDHDHAMTAVKYGLSKRPEPSEIIIPSEKLPPKWAKWQEMAD